MEDAGDNQTIEPNLVFSLRSLRVLCVSAMNKRANTFTAENAEEAQRISN